MPAQAICYVEDLSPEQRRRELVGLLAQGLLRWWQRRRLAGEVATSPQKTVPDSSASRLEVPR